jgi:hypothetical protein
LTLAALLLTAPRWGLNRPGGLAIVALYAAFVGIRVYLGWSGRETAMEAELVVDYACVTGEEAHWHPTEHQLYWLDNETGRLFWYDAATGQHAGSRTACSCRCRRSRPWRSAAAITSMS